jgi:hypothetical protein
LPAFAGLANSTTHGATAPGSFIATNARIVCAKHAASGHAADANVVDTNGKTVQHAPYKTHDTGKTNESRPAAQHKHLVWQTCLPSTFDNVKMRSLYKRRNTPYSIFFRCPNRRIIVCFKVIFLLIIQYKYWKPPPTPRGFY